jgi:hypothetical protein
VVGRFTRRAELFDGVAGLRGVTLDRGGSGDGTEPGQRPVHAIDLLSHATILTTPTPRPT